MRRPNRNSWSAVWFGQAAKWVPQATIAAILLAPTAAQAVLLAEERFLTSATPAGPQYAFGSLAGQNPNVLGFDGAWFTSDGASPTVDATSLNYSDANFPLETGGRMLSPTGNSRVHRLLAPATNPFESTDSGTVYMSFLLQTGTINGYRAFEMHNGGNSDADHRKLQIGVSSFGDFPSSAQFGFRVNNDGPTANLGAENTAVHLFLVKFNLTTASNGDVITVWNNPSIASLAIDPAGGVVASGFDFAADRLGAGHFTGTQYGFDELRIGTTLQDVVRNALYCDVNGNGVCNSTDTRIISDHMFLAGSFADGDVDGNGLVDFADVRLFKQHPARVVGFDPGQGSAAAAVPEPNYLVLVAAALVCCGMLAGRKSRRRLRACGAAQVVVVIMLASSVRVNAADEQFDLLHDNVNLFSGAALHMRPYVTMPAAYKNVIQMTHKPSDTRTFAVTEQGAILVVDVDTAGNSTPKIWFDASSALQTATGRTMHFTGSQQGLQSVAFHPNFEKVGQPGYGKFYTTMLEQTPANDADHFFLGNTFRGVDGMGNPIPADGVLQEWTYDHDTGQTDPNTYRELFRVKMQNYDHPIKLAQFNLYSEPGDEDYGLLYLTHGDSNNQDSPFDDPQDRGDVLGKMLRINPLSPSPGVPYSVPSSNPFYTSSSPSPPGSAVLGEVFAYGLRNPHNYSFNKDSAGNVRILVGDIGRSNMEEVNLIVAGANYGWPEREGTFQHLQGTIYPPNPSPNAGYYTGVTPLTANEVNEGVGPDGNRYVYPVAQYDHNDYNTEVSEDYTATSIAGGFVIRNGSDPALQNQFIFNNFAWQNGNVYHADFDAMLTAVTQLEPGNLSRDEPSELTQALKYRLELFLDHDNNSNTPELAVDGDDLNTLINGNPSNLFDRNDARYGEGISGEMYISSKINGTIYLVTNTMPNGRLTLTVDRSTRQMTITNGTGTDLDVDGLRVFSPSGSLDPAELQTVDAGWTPSPFNSPRDLTQSHESGAFEISGTSPVPLGDVFDPKLAGFGVPAGDDVQFVYTTPGPTGRSFVGDVVYTGVSTVPNTIVLTVDVASGQASLLNQTPFTQEVDGYTISSAGSINPAGWTSFEAQGIDDGDWFASPPRADRLTEFQENGTTTFDEQTPYSLGEIYQTGADRDLALEFQLAGEGALREGMVVYVLAGDYNGNNVVDAADYTTWRDHLGSDVRLANDMTPGDVGPDDYTTWKNNFGAVWTGPASGAGAGASPATVPEAAGHIMILSAVLALAGRAVGHRRQFGGSEQ